MTSINSATVLSKNLWFTYGPSTNSEAAVEAALAAGANGCRLTFSYGTCELQEERALLIKSIASRLKRSCTVVADLAGKKIRLGNFDPQSVEVRPNEVIRFCHPDCSTDIDAKIFSVRSASFFDFVEPGDTIVFGDGTLLVQLTDVSRDSICGFAIERGEINPNRGLIVRGKFNSSGLTDKDIDNISFIARSSSFDAVALSFVSNADMIISARDLVQQFDKDLPIVAKIETVAGIDQINEIARQADILMAARGDLALTMDWIELPDAVERIAQAARDSLKPWIVATQIVEGLENYTLPYRSEICDLAHWLRQSAGILLARETAYGANPTRAISTVAKMMERYAPVYN